MSDYAPASTLSPFALGPALLFCPASRPDRFPKAAERADAVIIDLEDAVEPDEKEASRQNLVNALNWDEPALDPATTLVRINTLASGELDADVEAIAGTELKYVIIPKCEEPEVLESVAQRLPGVGLIPQVETPLGVLNIQQLAQHHATTALFWGTEDLVAGLGGTTSRTPSGTYREIVKHVRNTILLVAGAYGVPAIDSINTNIRETQKLVLESEDACASGFIAKACIHPAQVEPVRKAYTPAAEDVEWAKSLVGVFRQKAGLSSSDATESADPSVIGAFSFRGEMVDAPVVIQAQRILTRYDATREHHPEEALLGE